MNGTSNECKVTFCTNICIVRDYCSDHGSQKSLSDREIHELLDRWGVYDDDNSAGMT